MYHILPYFTETVVIYPNLTGSSSNPRSVTV